MATEQTLINYTLNLDRAASLAFRASGKHNYSDISGSKPWQIALYLDGTLMNAVGGSGYGTDVPSVDATAPNVSAGSHTVRVTWYGHTSMQIRGVNLIIQGTKK